jgi:tetratricopeptide (TPR) repeat protein
VLDLDTHYLLTYVVLGQVHLATSRYDEAISALQSAVSVSEGLAFTSAALGHAYAKAGKRREAMKVLQSLQQRSGTGYVSPFCGAMVYAGLGDRDQAFAALDQAFEERSHWLAYIKAWPLVDDLRADARFTALLGRVGLR